MSQNTNESPSAHAGLSRDERAVDLAWWATWIGLLSAGVAFTAGLVIALEKKVIPCPDGTRYPADTTDFECYIHPDAAIGIAVAALSVVLATVVVLASMVARSALGERARPA